MDNYEDYLKEGDWASAKEKTEINDKAKPKTKEEIDYFKRAYASCFINSKEHKELNYQDIIDDCTKTIISKDNKAKKNNKAEREKCIIQVYLLRAYAYYLSKNYSYAIEDCKRIIEKSCCIAYAHELLGNIYSKIGKYEEAFNSYKKALSENIANFVNPSLMEKYMEARKKLDSH
ncbi:MAG: tetratricopeptide repeat protein [Elusimicrobiota bacterium]|jgi:tetratricopeptide (TPR) repeat protein|nr:tetratricopeptide repeat protein [Elusimicrobiota bacterium]